MSSKKKIENLVCRMHGLSGLAIEVMPADSMHKFKTTCRPCGDRFVGWCNERQVAKLCSEYQNYLDGLTTHGPSSSARTNAVAAPPLVPGTDVDDLPSRLRLLFDLAPSKPKGATE